MPTEPTPETWETCQPADVRASDLEGPTKTTRITISPAQIEVWLRGGQHRELIRSYARKEAALLTTGGPEPVELRAPAEAGQLGLLLETLPASRRAA